MRKLLHLKSDWCRVEQLLMNKVGPGADQCVFKGHSAVSLKELEKEKKKHFYFDFIE